MIFLISPAKSLDFSPVASPERTLPRLLSQTQELVTILKEQSADDLKALMGISDSLASLNYQRYQDFSANFTNDNSKPALLAFQGDVYQGINAADFDANDFLYASEYLRILSGLYGLLRPMDAIQPYRLEMGTKLATEQGRNLYQFWGTQITALLNEDLKASGSRAVINLASNEYFKSVNKKALRGNLYQIDFKEERNSKLKVISFFAKKARGMMCRFAIKNNIRTPEHLKAFAEDGYAFNEAISKEQHWIFTR